MKIRLAILETDVGYLNRIVTVFGAKYAEKIEIYSFTEKDMALSELQSIKADVLLASDSFEIDPKELPKRCGFAYFVDSMEVELLRGQPTICRFQKADLIYRQVLSLYAEHAGSMTELKFSDDGCRVIAFASPSGGAGSSTMAAACALHFAALGKKTLYLNLEKFGSPDDYFAGQGQFDMSDIIYALKTRKANISMKVESAVKQDPRGVFFISQSKLALDMLELTTEEILRLISELRLNGSYDCLILDAEFGLDKDALKVLHQAHVMVVVGDGSHTSNTKIFRAMTALNTKEENEDTPLINRTVLAYNRFSSRSGETIANLELRAIGGAPRYENAGTEQLLAQLSRNPLFDEIMK